ncbi:MAG TPA: RNA methyltransferase [Pirellulales bacterium]
MNELRISSVHNPRVREAAGLRDRRQRKRHGRCLIDGVRELSRALDAKLTPSEVFVCPELLSGEEAAALLDRLRQRQIPWIEVTPQVFVKLAYGERAAGVVAVATTPTASLADLELPADALVAVVEGLEKPGNLGAVLRSADGAGVSAVLVADPNTDLFNPNTIRASVGTIFSQRVAVAASSDIKEWLSARGVQMIAARVDAKVDYFVPDYTLPTAIVLGSEAEGLGAVWRAADVTPVRLPMLGVADSLNVSAAAAVLFYEARRQRASRT